MSNKIVPQQAKAGFVLAIEKLQRLTEDDWDWSPNSKSPIAKLNSWLRDNPKYRLVDTPRIESRLLSRQIENSIETMTFSVSVSYLYEDISERVYDDRHTGVFEGSSEQGRTKEGQDNEDQEKEEEKAFASAQPAGKRPANLAASTAGYAAKPRPAANDGDRSADASATSADTESADAAAAAASGSAEHSGSAKPATSAKFSNAADALDYLAELGISIPDSATRTVAGLAARAAIPQRGPKHRPNQND